MLPSRKLALFSMSAVLAASASANQTGPDKVLPILKSATLTGHLNGTTPITTTISFTLKNAAAFQSLVSSVSNPKSKNYMHFLTPAQIGQQFGQSAGIIQQAVSFLKSNGFQVKLVDADGLHIQATGTAKQAEAAFHTTLNTYHQTTSQIGYADFYSYATAPQLPNGIASVVAHVGGLSSFAKPHPTTVLDPNMTRTLYGTLPMYQSGFQGVGRTVAISNWDGYRLSNLPLYYSSYGLPTPSGGIGSNVTIRAIQGGSGTGSAQGEGDLDIQMILGQAPLCHLIVYDGPPTSDMTDVLTLEQSDNSADIISESWEWTFDDNNVTYNAAHTLHQEMTAQGITYMGAAGDYGTFVRFLYPHFDPEVLSVGGTAAQTDSTGNRLSEVAWGVPTYADFGGGGGWVPYPISFNTLPSWQTGSGVPTNLNYRLYPDISAHAAGKADLTQTWEGAYWFVYGGQLNNGYVGTSFACPVFAGSLAIAEQKLKSEGVLRSYGNGIERMGRIQDLIYSQAGRPDVYHDITQGTNGPLPNGQMSTAGPGWDTCTGWGTIDWDQFVKSIVPPVVSIPITAQIFSNEGTSSAGSSGFLNETDGADYSVQSVLEPAGQTAAAQLTWTISDPSSFSSIGVNLSTYGGPNTVSQFVYLKNIPQTNLQGKDVWDVVNISQLTGTSDAPNTVYFALDPNKYVDENNQVYAIVRGVQPARLSKVPYRLYVDQATITESE